MNSLIYKVTKTPRRQVTETPSMLGVSVSRCLGDLYQNDKILSLMISIAARNSSSVITKGGAKRMI